MIMKYFDELIGFTDFPHPLSHTTPSLTLTGSFVEDKAHQTSKSLGLNNRTLLELIDGSVCLPISDSVRYSNE